MKPFITTAAHAAVETLEARRLLSAVTLSAGTLLVQGDANAASHINLTVARGTLHVVDKQIVRSYPLSSVTGVHIVCGSKGDTVDIGSGLALPTEIDGGGGNDHITAGGEDDLIITGAGQSTINAGAGKNYINGTFGRGVINVTRTATDTIVANAGFVIRGKTTRTTTALSAAQAAAKLMPAQPVMPWAIPVVPIIPPPPPPPVLPPPPPPPPPPVLPPPPTITPPVLVPGTGFTGPTTQPAAVGDPTAFGYGDMAVARWDVVPYQTFTSTFNVGVVAFANTGIDHVSFSVNGGAWASVSQMSLNTQVANNSATGDQSGGVFEYVATLRASDFADGSVEVRAIVYPTVGIPRVLAGPISNANVDDGVNSMFLNTDSNGTLPQLVRYVATTGSDTTGDGSQANPFATIFKAALTIQAATGLQDADNGVIYLMPGSYCYADRVANGGYVTPSPITNSGWLTIAGTPGQSADQVQLTSSASNQCLDTHLVHLQNLTVTTNLACPNDLNARLWIDGCVMTATGTGDDLTFAGPTSWTGGIYVTNTTIENVVDALDGSTFERNVAVTNIGSDAFMDSHELINVSVAGILVPPNAGYHPDVLQISGSTYTNVVYYGITAVTGITSQGLFGDAASTNTAIAGAAFVNININNQTTGISPDFQVFQFCCPINNAIFLDDNFVGPAYWRPDLGFVGSDIVLSNTAFSLSPGLTTGVTYQSAHAARGRIVRLPVVLARPGLFTSLVRASVYCLPESQVVSR